MLASSDDRCPPCRPAGVEERFCLHKTNMSKVREEPIIAGKIGPEKGYTDREGTVDWSHVGLYKRGNKPVVSVLKGGKLITYTCTQNVAYQIITGKFLAVIVQYVQLYNGRHRRTHWHGLNNNCMRYYQYYARGRSFFPKLYECGSH